MNRASDLAAIRWLVAGYGYEITSADVLAAYTHTLIAAERAGCRDETMEYIRKLVAEDSAGGRFAAQVLIRILN